MKNELIKNSFQKAFIEFKEQYMKDTVPAYKKEINNLFRVSLNEIGGICVDDIYIGINISNCEKLELLSFQVYPEYIIAFLNENTSAVIHISCEYGFSIPKIKFVKIEKEVYSCE